ncbi:MAG TPA: ABC transporter substrate-binding protein [Terriglobia bacterium]|nr:ABC transporter substrate-binding protein [Terriglobia bacterium]
MPNHSRLIRHSLAAAIFLLAPGIASAQRMGPAPIKLRVSLGDVDITKIVGAVALDEGIYQRNGLEVEQWITPGAAEIARGNGVMVPEHLVRSGTADVGIGGGTPLVVSVATNVDAADRVILGSLDHVVHWWIVAKPEIKRLEDLKGKRIGYSGIGAMTHFIILELARRMNWHPTLDIAPLSNAISVDNLLNDQVDAFICPGMAMVEFKARGIEPMADLRKLWGDVPIAGSGLTSTKKFVRENPEAIRRFMKSIVEAIALMKQNREVAFKALTRWYGVTDREKLHANYLVADTLPRKPYPAVEGIKKTMELYDSLQMRKHTPEDFYDDRFVRELDESGYIDSLYR